MPVYKDGSFFESWHDVSFNAQVDYNQSREPSLSLAPSSNAVGCAGYGFSIIREHAT